MIYIKNIFASLIIFVFALTFYSCSENGNVTEPTSAVSPKTTQLNKGRELKAATVNSRNLVWPWNTGGMADPSASVHFEWDAMDENYFAPYASNYLFNHYELIVTGITINYNRTFYIYTNTPSYIASPSEIPPGNRYTWTVKAAFHRYSPALDYWKVDYNETRTFTYGQPAPQISGQWINNGATYRINFLDQDIHNLWSIFGVWRVYKSDVNPNNFAYLTSVGWPYSYNYIDISRNGMSSSNRVYYKIRYSGYGYPDWVFSDDSNIIQVYLDELPPPPVD